MKIFLISVFTILFSTQVFAQDCSLEEAKGLLKADLEVKVSDDAFGTVDFCIGENAEQEISEVVARLIQNPEDKGGDYLVALCEASQDDRYDILYADVYCSGVVGYHHYTLD